MKFFKNSRGLTLLEVVAGIVILGTLLVGVVMATSRLRTSSYMATRRVEAYEAADALLEEWQVDGLQKIPRDDSGEIEDSDWSWRTSSKDAEIKGIDAEIVTLEIIEDGIEQPLASVDVLVTNEDEEVQERD